LASDFNIRLLCDLIGLAHSSFYYQSQAKDDSLLRIRIEQLSLQYTRYGYRRTTGMLRRENERAGDEKVNHKRVQRLMQEMGLQVHQKRRKIKTTDTPKGQPPFPNLLKGLEIERPDQIWCADITYIPLAGGRMVYLAFLLDIFTRMILCFDFHLEVKTKLRLLKSRLRFVKSKLILWLALGTGFVRRIDPASVGQSTGHRSYS